MWVNLTLSIVLKVGKCKDSFGLAAMWGRETNLAEHGINLAHVLGKPPFNYEHFVQHLDIFRASTIWRVWPWQQFSLCKDPLPFPFNWMDPFATSPLSLLFSGGVATIVYCLFSLMYSLIWEGLQPWRIVSSLPVGGVCDWIGWFGRGCNHGVLSLSCARIRW